MAKFRTMEKVLIPTSADLSPVEINAVIKGYIYTVPSGFTKANPDIQIALCELSDRYTNQEILALANKLMSPQLIQGEEFSAGEIGVLRRCVEVTFTGSVEEAVGVINILLRRARDNSALTTTLLERHHRGTLGTF